MCHSSNASSQSFIYLYYSAQTASAVEAARASRITQEGWLAAGLHLFCR